MVIFHSYVSLPEGTPVSDVSHPRLRWPRYVEVSSEEEPELFFKDDQQFRPGGPRFGCQVWALSFER